MKRCYTNKRNLCPVCGNHHGCAIREDNLVECLRSTSQHDAQPGYRFIKLLRNGMGGLFTLEGDRPIEPRHQERQQQEKKAAAERALGALPIADRDRAIRKLHRYFGLGSKHRQDLRARGLSDALINGVPFFSVYPDQELPPGIPANLPGVTRRGDKLYAAGSGYICPSFDLEGRVNGWQIRYDDPEEAGAKYKWSVNPHLPSGELAITVALPVGGVKLKSVRLAEGFLKPYIAAQKTGQVTIGSPNGQFAGSPKQTLAALEAYCVDNTVTLTPDAGDVCNRQVMQRWADQIEWLQSQGYTVVVEWWDQFDKTHPDVDELTGDETKTYISPQEFLNYAPSIHQAIHQDFVHSPKTLEPEPDAYAQYIDWEEEQERIEQAQTIEHSFSRIAASLSTCLEASKKRLKAWGFGKSSSQKEYPAPQALVAEYKPGFRLDTWREAAKSQFILDSSETGTGKSFDAGRVTPELLGCDRVFYVTSDPRNPTTETLKDWELLDGRHQGLKVDSLSKIRRVKRDEAYTIPPNCRRVDTIGALRDAGIEGADSSGLICPTCPSYEACKGGYLFGYLNARMNALKLPRLRSHPASLPVPTGEDAFDYSNSALIWEEWNTILKNTRILSVNQGDLDKLIVELVAKAPEQFIKLQPILTALRRLITGEVKQPNRFGWNHHKLIEQLPALPLDIDLDALTWALKPDLSLLDPTAEYGVSAAELPARMRKKFTSSDNAVADIVRGTLVKQWLMPFLRVLRGKPGYFTLSYGQLTITTPDERLVNIAHAARRNIFLDATGHLDELALLLAIMPEEIYHIRQQPSPGAEVKRVQVAGMGRLGQHRGKEQQRRASAVVDALLKRHPNAGVIRFKRLASDGDYRWFIESRGVNDAQELDTLILDGIPCENLESLAAEFACIYGRAPIEGMTSVRTPIVLTNSLPDGIEPYFESSISADPGFAEFVRRRILANIHQAEGRLRASRRQGEKLSLYILGDFALDVPMELVKASDITEDAASKTERVELAIRAAVEQLKAIGEKVTQSRVANLTGYTRGHISRFRKLIILLIEGTISNAIAPESPPDPPPEELEWFSKEYLPLIADSPLNDLLSLVDVYGKGGFNQIWNGATASTQVKILSQAIRCLLSGGELRQLALTVGVKL